MYRNPPTLLARRIMGLPAALVALTLASCSSSGPDDPAATASARAAPFQADSCFRLADLGVEISTEISPLCPLCSVTAPQHVADGDLQSATRMAAPASAVNQGVKLTIVAEDGLIFPRGTHPAIFYSGGAAGTGNADDRPLQIRSYLGGEPADSGALTVTVDLDSEEGARSAKYFRAENPWNRLEIVMANSQYMAFDIYEACWDIDELGS